MRWWVFIKLGRPRRAAAAPAIPAAAAASVGRRGLLLACSCRAGPGRADWPLARAGSAKQFWRRQIG